MARKKDIPTEPSPETPTTSPSELPSDTNGIPIEEIPTPPAAPANGHTPPAAKRRPVISFRCPADRTTNLSAAVWANEVTYADGEQGIQYSVSLSRSYKDQDGKWHDSSKDDAGNPRSFSYRVHELPIVLYLLQRCHNWALSQRTQVAGV